MKGYGCTYTEKEIVLGIKFDHVKRTVSFYKNGIDHGIAFRNVPSGLTPSIDVWFQEGNIELQNNINFEVPLILIRENNYLRQFLQFLKQCLKI